MEARTSDDVVEMIKSEIKRLAIKFPRQCGVVLSYLKGVSPRLYELFVGYLEEN